MLSALIKTLTHKLRSPLSVICNDLNFLKDKLADAEIERPLRRAQEISDILKTLDKMRIAPTKPSMVSLDDFCRECLPGYVQAPSDLKAQIRLDCGLCKLAFEQLKALLEYLKLKTSCVLVVQGSKLSVNFKSSEALPGALLALKGRHYSSLSQALILDLGLDLLQPPIIDSLFWAQACNMRLSCEEGLNLEIEFDL